MGVDPGDVFVHRNIANIVPNTDLNALSVVNYAVNQLSVEHIVVCGHYNCGGVKAAMQSHDQKTLNPWLCSIKDVARMHETELAEMETEDERYNRLVELNVQEQCINLLKIACVQDAFLSNKLALHGWVFDIRSGKIVDLEIDFDEIWNNLRSTYQIS
jgi:carbonic anhydrase